MADISYAKIASQNDLEAKFRGLVAGFLQADRATPRLERTAMEPPFDPDFWRIGLQERIARNFPGVAFGTVDPHDPAAVDYYFAFEVDDVSTCQRDPERLDATLARVFVSLLLLLESAMDEDGVSLVLCQIEGMEHFPRLVTMPTGAIRGLIRYRPIHELAPHHALPCSNTSAAATAAS